MEFRLLGPVQAVAAGQPIELGSRRQRSLLALLVLQANRVVSADSLIDELWGEEPPRTARTALHVQISRLRRTLDEGGHGNRERILTEPSGYRLVAARDEVDLLRFKHLAARGAEALRGGDAENALADLDQALRLWRGSPLADVADHPFAGAAAAELDQLRMTAEEDRIDAELALGHHHSAADQLRRLTAEQPLRERRWAQLMLALYRGARQADALRAFQALRWRLAEDLGIDPSPEVRGLEEAILVQDPKLDWRPPARDDPPDRPPGPPEAPTPFVGRERELKVLVGALEAALSGRPRVVLVSGEPGIGKTRLVEELAALAEERGVCVAWGRCQEGEGVPPYWPWTQVIRACAIRHGEGAEPAEVASRAPELARLAPDLYPDDPMAPETQGAPARSRLFEAVARLLLDTARAQPVMLVIDDLHWADRSPLALLEFLSRQLQSSRLLLVGTFRDVDLGPDHPLHATVGALAESPNFERLRLSGLGALEVSRLMEASAGTAAGPLAPLVHARTEGNPFYAREVVRMLEAEGHLTAGGGPAATAVPQTVRDVVARRTQRLGPEARWVVTVAAVVGRDFELDVVATAAGVDSDRLLDLVDEAAASGLVTEAPEPLGCYRFSHDIVRQAIYDSLSRVRRARLHARVADALEQSPWADRQARLSRLADHLFLAAPGGGDVAKAVRYAVEAAREATAALAYDEAVMHYDRGLRALAGAVTPDETMRCELLLGLGDARWRTADVPAARESFLEAARMARTLGRPDLMARAVLGYGGGLLRDWHATRGAVGEQLVELLEEALVALGEDEVHLRVRLLGHLAEELYYVHGAESRRDELTSDAVALARKSGDPSTVAFALSSRVLALWSPEHLEQRRALAAEIVELGGRLQNAELTLFGRHYLFVAQLEAGDVDEAVATVAALEVTADELRLPLYRWEAKWFRAVLALQSGGFADAERLAFEALELGQQAGDPDSLSIFGVQIGIIRLEQGRVGELEPAVRSFIEEFPETATWRAALALVLMATDRLEEAQAELDALAADGFACLPHDFSFMAAMAMLAWVANVLGDQRRAETLYAMVLPFAHHNALTADRSSWGAAARYVGLLATTTGRHVEAEEWFGRALAMNARMGARPWEAHTYHDRARLFLSRRDDGDLPRAVADLQAAEALSRELGMAWLEASIERTRLVAEQELAPRPTHLRPSSGR